MANPPNQIRQILDQWNSHPAEVKTWPPGPGSQYTIEHWLDYIELGCHRRGIQPGQYVNAAIFFLRGQTQQIMTTIHQHHPLQWDAFKTFMVEVQESEGNAERRRELLNKLAGGGLMAGGAAVVLPAAGITALNAIGFTSSGVLAGSIAAGIQSVFYGGMTGGLFSLCQSIGATAVAAPPLAIGLGIGALVVGAGLAFSPSSNGGSGDDDDSPPAGPAMAEIHD
ncbi:hypothetical protein Moror_16618 [Moniliophthora roreri MCA 2997]|uniref:Uncharacterized protein n=2 Tax=Moniliophthora roreri TaxID=221103 RepID=V2Y3Q3_MONRO|nr:hypothetical protein Moror_16618 [Moniliophthora roreri MCA 2997]KAI3602213.1 hypothetical protein WG66_002463 [Moniliophthora roreri]